MFFRSTILALLLLASSTCSFGQNKSVVVIIDTLIGNADLFFTFSYIAAKDYSFYSDGRRLALDDSMVTVLLNNKHPQIIETIEVLPGSDVLLPLDSKGGRFAIKNVDKLDTLRIAKWEILKHNLPDTTITTLWYFRIVNDSMADEPYKTKLRKKRHKGSEKNALSSLNIVINGKSYSAPLHLETGSAFTTGHGYKPLRKYYRFMKYSDRNEHHNRKFKYTYFKFRSIRTSYEYSGALEL